MNPGTRVELIEEEAGQDPACPIPTGTVVSSTETDVTVRWDQPDYLPAVDTWPTDRIRPIPYEGVPSDELVLIHDTIGDLVDTLTEAVWKLDEDEENDLDVGRKIEENLRREMNRRQTIKRQEETS